MALVGFTLQFCNRSASVVNYYEAMVSWCQEEELMPDERKPDPADDKPHPKVFHIQIDREHYEIETAEMTGAQLRKVPPTPIPPERDLFEVVPGHPDRKIESDDIVEIRNGLRFFTAPGTINPGRSLVCR